MVNSAVQLTFPCPGCGGFVTLRRFSAVGPCPSCGMELQVNVYIRPLTSSNRRSGGAGSDAEQGKRFEKRRFRPAPQSSL